MALTAFSLFSLLFLTSSFFASPLLTISNPKVGRIFVWSSALHPTLTVEYGVKFSIWIQLSWSHADHPTTIGDSILYPSNFFPTKKSRSYFVNLNKLTSSSWKIQCLQNIEKNSREIGKAKGNGCMHLPHLMKTWWQGKGPKSRKMCA